MSKAAARQNAKEKRVLLLRHAKSAWDAPDLDDHERPLSKRGIKAAPLMGAFMAKNELWPTMILCSDAVRTRATCALVLPELGQPQPGVIFDPAIYLADPVTILGLIRKVDQRHNTIMVIGHNPGLHALALSLTGGGDKTAIGDMAMKFPTAALAVLSFNIDDWKHISTSRGYLELFQTPRAL